VEVFVNEETISEEEKVMEKLALVYKRINLIEVMNYLRHKLCNNVTNNFVANWKDNQFKECIRNLPKDSVVDFTKNYKFENKMSFSPCIGIVIKYQSRCISLLDTILIWVFMMKIVMS